MTATTDTLNEYRTHTNDTGGAGIQIAMLTGRISHLATHLETHPKDVASRRGLLKMVARRRKLLTYLKSEDDVQYEKVRVGLGLRK